MKIAHSAGTSRMPRPEGRALYDNLLQSADVATGKEPVCPKFCISSDLAGISFSVSGQEYQILELPWRSSG